MLCRTFLSLWKYHFSTIHFGSGLQKRWERGRGGVQPILYMNNSILTNNYPIITWLFSFFDFARWVIDLNLQSV